MHGRVVSAPVQIPNRQEQLRKIRRIAEDACTTTVLTTTDTKAEVEQRFSNAPELAGLTLVPTDEVELSEGTADSVMAPAAQDVALPQYTSGSTGDPKGGMIRYANFFADAVQPSGSALWGGRGGWSAGCRTSTIWA